MKILFISQYFHPEPFSNNDIARFLVARGHEVEAVSCVPNYPDGTFYPGHSNKTNRVEQWEGVRILRARTIARGKRPLTLFLNYLFYPLAALATIARRGSGSYSVSFTSMPSPIFQCIVALVVKLVNGVPAVYWVQDIWPESLFNTIGIRNPLLRSPIRAFCAFLYRHADIVLVQSEAFRPKLEAMGVDPGRIAFFPNSSPGDFEPIERGSVDPAIAALLPPAPLRLMFAGNVGESQNLDIFIEAAKHLRGQLDVQWIIVGSGRDLKRVTARVAEAGLEDIVIFAGRHPMNKMPEFYALADAMFVSLKDTEIFRMTVPYKLQTYMSAGKPVIGSISGETRNIVEAAQIGFCADAEDVNGLCVAVQRFAALTPSEKRTLSANAIKYFNAHYSADRVFGELERQLLSVVKPV